MTLGAGDRVDRYMLEELLGEGGQGSVWRARDPLSPGDARAVKLIETRRASDTELERARREARALAKLDHPSLCRCHGLFEDVHHHVLGVALDFADGVSLAAAIDDARMTPALREQALMHVAGALAHVHRHGLVHRDVKPLNVMVGSGFWNAPGDAGHIKLVDFGIADIGHGKRLTQQGHVMGTPPYMAPEQIEPSHWGDERTAAIDVFSFGVMCWLVLMGRHPTGLGSEAHLGDYAVAYRRAASGAWPPRLPVACALTPALTKALALHARDRWPDCGALLGAVAPASPAASETRVHGSPRAGGPASSLGAAALTARQPTVEEHPVFPTAEKPGGAWRWVVGLVLVVQACVAGIWLWSNGVVERWVRDDGVEEDDAGDRDEEEDDEDDENEEDEPVAPPPPASASASGSTEPLPVPPPPTKASVSPAHDSCSNYASVVLPTGSYIARLSASDHLDAKGRPFVEPHAVLIADREHQNPSDGDDVTPGISTKATASALLCTLFKSQFKGSIPYLNKTREGRRILRGEPRVRVTFRGRTHARVEIIAGDCRDLEANVEWLTHPNKVVPDRQKWINYLLVMRKLNRCDQGLEELNSLYELH